METPVFLTTAGFAAKDLFVLPRGKDAINFLHVSGRRRQKVAQEARSTDSSGQATAAQVNKSVGNSLFVEVIQYFST